MLQNLQLQVPTPTDHSLGPARQSQLRQTISSKPAATLRMSVVSAAQHTRGEAMFDMQDGNRSRGQTNKTQEALPALCACQVAGT